MKLKKLGLIEYESAFKAMKEKVDKGLTENEIWILEHPPVFTVGVNKKICYYPILLPFPYSLVIGEEK